MIADNHGKCTPNDPNVDTFAIVPAHANPEHAPAQPVGLGNGFHPWVGGNIPNNQNGWMEEDPEENDDDWEVDDEAEVIEPYTGDDLNNPPSLISEDEETHPTSPVIPDADGQPIPPIASFGQNFHFGESLSTANLLTENSKFDPTGPMCPNLGTVWRKMREMKKFMMERIDIVGRMKKKFKEQDRHFVGLGCDNIQIDRTDKKIPEKELVNERNRNDFYREFGEYMCRMLQKRQKSEDGLPVPSGSQVRKSHVEPFARSAPALRSADPYTAAAVTTSNIDDTASMDSQPYEPRGSPRDSQ
ncbi:hypothetical protein Tco_0562448 [Tanacetum coccineum]